MTDIKVGQIWRRKADGTLVEVRNLNREMGFWFSRSQIDVIYRRVGIKRIGTSNCYANNFVKRYQLVEEVAS